MAPPAVLWFAACIVAWEIVGWYGCIWLQLDIPEIFISKRRRIVFDVIEHMKRAVLGVFQQAKTAFRAIDENLQIAIYRDVVFAHFRPTRNRKGDAGAWFCWL